MRFNPSHQSYGSGHFYTDEHGNIKMTHDINVAIHAKGKALYDKHKSGHNCGGFGQPACPPREGATPEEIAYYEYLVSKTWKGPEQQRQDSLRLALSSGGPGPAPRLQLTPPLQTSAGIVRNLGGLTEGATPVIILVLALAGYGIYSIARRKQ